MFVPLPKRDEPEFNLQNSNDIIISDSLILQASRALSGQVTEPGILFDLAALVEAVILYDHLLFLGDASHNVFNDLPLGRLLMSENIIQGFAAAVTKEEVQESIYRLFGIPDAYEKLNLSPFFARQDLSGVLPYYGEYDFFSPNQVSMVLAELELAGKLPPLDKPLPPGTELIPNLPHYCFSLVETWVGDNSWARRPAQAFLVRTLVYWAISDRLNITFYPDFTRLAIVAHITRNLQSMLSLGAIHAIAQAFYSQPEDLLWMNDPFAVNIPPLIGLVLERAGSEQQIGTAMLELREEFSELRTAMRMYQRTIRSASSLAELQQTRNNLLSEADRLSQVYSVHDCVRLQETTSYYQRAVHIVDRPLDPDAYAMDLNFKPVDWIREWWIRRNAIHLIDLGDKLNHYDYYRELIRKTLDIELDESQVQQYHQVDNKMKRLYYNLIQAKP